MIRFHFLYVFNNLCTATVSIGMLRDRSFVMKEGGWWDLGSKLKKWDGGEGLVGFGKHRQHGPPLKR